MTRLGFDTIGKIIASRRVLAAAAAAMAWLVLTCAPGVACAQSSLTPAATMIDNVAQLSFVDGARSASLPSNHVALQVQEILDVRVDVLTPFIDTEAGASDQRLAFRITNLGNGWQAFDLSFSHVDDDFDPESCRIIIDWDGDGLLDMTRDRVTSTTPVLAPGASVVAWVSCGIPASTSHGALGRILLRAFPAVLRGGSTESAMANAGNGGVYVVMGPSLRGGGGGDGAVSPPGGFRVGKVDARLVKTQAVTDSAGGARAMPGSIVTYSLEARFGAGPAVRDAKISDAIPAGSDYVAGSLTLDGASLSDGVDADAGRFAGGAIEVGLGDIAAPVTRVVTFKVRINPIGSSS
jgi:hypothetical protein